MKEFTLLLETTDRLLGPGGCPWDREQTMKSTRSCIIEEASELVDAIDSEDNDHIREELGDLLFVVLFLCRLAEKEKCCDLTSVLQDVNEKLIRRHPHVFGEVKIGDSDAVLKQWDKIKQKEKGKEHRKSALDSLAKGLPALARAQKVSKKMGSVNFPHHISTEASFTDEESLGKLLFDIVTKAQSQGLDAEHALRKTLVGLEGAFRAHENQLKPHDN